MSGTMRNKIIWIWLTLPIAILLLVAAGGGLFIPGLYRDNPNLLAQAIGQDLVSLAVVLPALVVSALLASRGSARARLVWLGVLGYLVYSYATFAFGIRFNQLFLVYVALLGCSLYTLIGGLATTDVTGIEARFSEKAPRKLVSIFFGLVVVLFYFFWLSELVPALMAGEIPQSILEDGTPTNSVHVVDMAWILPAFAIAAVKLWRKQALGYTLAGALLAYLALMVLAILSMAVFELRGGQPDAIPMVFMFGILFAASLGLSIWYLKDLRSEQVRRGYPIPASSG